MNQRATRRPTIAGLVASIAELSPDVECVVHGETRLTWRELARRVRRVARLLDDLGCGIHVERDALASWQSGQDHVGLMMRNRVEFLEAMLGSFTARAVPFNLNFRYTVAELAEVFADARPAVVVVSSEFAEVAAAAAREVVAVRTVFQVADATPAPLVPGCRWWNESLADLPSDPVRTDWSPDDLYMLFTGGTTGTPKGVLWRQEDALVSAFGVARRDGSPHPSLEVAAAQATVGSRHVMAPCPPLIHGAAQWSALGTMFRGGKVVLPDDGGHFSPEVVLDTIEHEGVTDVLVVGDAFGRQLADRLEVDRRDFPSLGTILNGGAALSSNVRVRLQRRLPHVRVVDSLGASETGRQATRAFAGGGDGDVRLAAMNGTVVVSPDRRRVLPPGTGEVGWLARRGAIPLGYLDDEAKTRATFPYVEGVRYVVPGDRAAWPRTARSNSWAGTRRRSTRAARRCTAKRSRTSSRRIHRSPTAW